MQLRLQAVFVKETPDELKRLLVPGSGFGEFRVWRRVSGWLSTAMTMVLDSAIVMHCSCSSINHRTCQIFWA